MTMKLTKLIAILLFVILTTVGKSQSFPQKITKNNQIIHHQGFTLSYNEDYEQPNWVRYVLKASSISNCQTKAKRKNSFVPDTKIETGSATSKDYEKSGYDRGHLKPAADEPCNQERMNETFLFSNVSPQVPSFNRGIWKKLENYERKVALTADSVVVITGGILTSFLTTIGPDHVAVPKWFFKILYIHKADSLIILAFVIPNKKSNEPLFRFKVQLDDLERLARLKFE